MLSPESSSPKLFQSAQAFSCLFVIMLLILSPYFSITEVSTYDVARGVYDVIWSAGDPGDPADAAARVLSGM